MRATSGYCIWFSCLLSSAFLYTGCTGQEGSSDSSTDNETDDSHGKKETVTLDDGTKMQLPMYFKARGGIMVVGTADIDALRSLQRSLDAYSPIEQSGRGICFLWFFDYSADSDLGAYTEVAITHMATLSKAPLEPDFDITNFWSLATNFTTLLEKEQIVNSALWLNSELGIAAGEQIWGYPKLKAQFSDSSEVGEDGLLHRAVKVVENQSGKTVLSFNLSIPESMLPVTAIPRQEGLTTGTWDNTNGPHRLYSHMENLESIAIGAWDKEKDELELGSGTEQLDMLQALDFQPMGSLVYGGFDLYIESPMEL